MSNKIMSRSEGFYLQNEATFGQIPNSSGTATVSGSDACAGIKFSMRPIVATARRRDKTGSRTRLRGVATKMGAEWSFEASLVTSGTPGTACDHDPIYRSAFGAAPTVTSGTVSISGATNATPIVITTSASHGLTSYDVVRISGVGGNTNANDVWAVNVLTATTFELIGSAGNAAYTSGGTVHKAAVYYTPTDAEPSFTGWSARVPYATAAQRAIGGCVTTELSFQLGEDIATFRANGDGMWVLNNLHFSSYTTAQKLGLTSFPDLSLLTPATTGDGIAGYKGRAVINGSEVTRIRTASMRYGSAVVLPRDTFGRDLPDTPEADERAVSVDFDMYEDDSAGQAAVEYLSQTKGSLDMIFQIGTVTGNICVAVLRGVQLESPERDDGQRAFTMRYNGSQVYGSSMTAFNEMRFWQL